MKSTTIQPHICHLVLGLPLGGTEALVTYMLRNPPEGYRSSAVCLDEIGILGESALADGRTVTLIPRGHRFDWRVARKIAQYCKAHKVDILHCHHYTPWCYGALARLWNPNPRVVFTEHGRLYPDEPSFKRRLFNKAILPLTDVITAVSPFVADALASVEQIPPHRISVIFNGVDEARFVNLPDKRELRNTLGLDHETLYFILCSRLDPIKWIEGLLAAFRSVIDAFAGCRLLLIGEGEARGRIEADIERLHLGGAVLLAGYRRNVPEWLAASDIFVLSSHSEGTSVSLVESMAAGLPSVVTNAGGNAYVVEDGVTGIVVPVRDVDALAAAMLSLARDPDLRRRYAENAHRRFRNLFAMSRMLNSYAAVYEKLMN